jgi:hypothetical protein
MGRFIKLFSDIDRQNQGVELSFFVLAIAIGIFHYFTESYLTKIP